jgi:hypothetical protein
MDRFYVFASLQLRILFPVVVVSLLVVVPFGRHGFVVVVNHVTRK